MPCANTHRRLVQAQVIPALRALAPGRQSALEGSPVAGRARASSATFYRGILLPKKSGAARCDEGRGTALWLRSLLATREAIRNRGGVRREGAGGEEGA